MMTREAMSLLERNARPPFGSKSESSSSEPSREMANSLSSKLMLQSFLVNSSGSHRSRPWPNTNSLILNNNSAKHHHRPLASSVDDDLIFRGCRGCGKEEKESGCNGDGRIQGGIATVPGFGWWPIKAYRPCPAFVEAGGRYRRIGQSMDEVVSGRGDFTSTDSQLSNEKSSSTN